MVPRDRSGRYALAVAQALPHATQVADSWHLIENATPSWMRFANPASGPHRGRLRHPKSQLINRRQAHWLDGGLGTIFSLVIGSGLTALMFYRSRSGYDEAVVIPVQDRRGDEAGKL